VATARQPDPPARGPRDWWRGLPRHRRRALRIALAVAMLLVIAIGALLARYLQTSNVERDDDLALIEAEARGEVAGMISRLHGCAGSPSCVAAVKRNASNPLLHRAGAVKILSLSSATESSLGGATGPTRLAWTVIGKLPVVQCIEVRRSGNFFAGITVTLLSLSAPIPGEDKCTKETALEREEEEATALESGQQ